MPMGVQLLRRGAREPVCVAGARYTALLVGSMGVPAGATHRNGGNAKQSLAGVPAAWTWARTPAWM